MPECSIEGCEKNEQARGYCSFHYYRWRTYGNPLAEGRKKGRPHKTTFEAPQIDSEPLSELLGTSLGPEGFSRSVARTAVAAEIRRWKETAHNSTSEYEEAKAWAIVGALQRGRLR